MGTGEFKAGESPAMDYDQIQGSRNTSSRFMHSTEIGIRSGLMSHLARVHFERVIIKRDAILEFCLIEGKVIKE